MQLVLYTTLHEHDREVSVLERLSDGATDGAIILLPLESSGELVALQESGFPFVVVDPRIPLDDGIPAVSAAHRAGALAATEHLLSPRASPHRPHQRPRGVGRNDETIEGYHSALQWPEPAHVRARSSRATSRRPPGSPPPTFSSTWQITDRDLRGERQHGRRMLQVSTDRGSRYRRSVGDRVRRRRAWQRS